MSKLSRMRPRSGKIKQMPTGAKNIRLVSLMESRSILQEIEKQKISIVSIPSSTRLGNSQKRLEVEFRDHSRASSCIAMRSETSCERL